MMATFDTIFKNGTVVNQDGKGLADVGVRNGKIAAIGSLPADNAGEVVDCNGLHVLPGVIDSQVHFREPGSIHKEDLESGSKAAVMGGVTAVFEMPNTNPTTTNEAALADKVSRATNRMHCDFAFWVGGTRENAHEVAELERLPGAAGIKVFMGSSTGNLLVEDDDGVSAILSRINRRAAFHSEDEFRLRDRMGERVPGDPSSHPVWRDAEAALICTKRLVSIAQATGARIHVLHISTAAEMDYLKDVKDVATCELTPHHLTLSSDDYASLGTLLQMNPPVRDKSHRDKLWWGLDQGIADVLGSDHAPHTLDEKAKPYPESPSGMTGVQTLVPIMLDHVANGRLSIERFVDLSSHGPQRIFGIANKGRLAVGYDADMTIVDLKRAATVENSWIASKCGWTPYDKKSIHGWPIGTIIRGKRVMWEDELVTASNGAAVQFQESLSR
ncbi:MAG: dihydroorotase [Hyphomicrobiales bacterium]